MISLKNVSYKYKDGNEVLKGVNLDVNQGEFVCIVGRNGSGKSTLGKIISGLIVPTKGQVLIDDMDTKNKRNFLDIRRDVQIVFQNPENQLVFSRVEDEFAFALKNLGLDNIRERTTQSLMKTSTIDFLDKDIYELSLGQKQRIAIAEVLSINPKYIIFDEPTTMIDSKGKEDVYEVVRNLKQDGYTAIYITNYSDEILLADRIIVMEEGEVALEIQKSELINYTSELKKYDVKMSPIIELIVKLKEKGIEIDITNLKIEDIVSKVIEVIEG